MRKKKKIKCDLIYVTMNVLQFEKLILEFDAYLKRMKSFSGWRFLEIVQNNLPIVFVTMETIVK